MKKNLIRVSTVDMPRAEWLAYRHSGIGGSEAGAILGLNPYKASIALFEEKLRPPRDIEQNEAMFFGSVLEDLVAKIWQSWQTDISTTIKNFNAEIIIRKCRRVNAYLRDPENDFLFASLDRLMNQDSEKEEGVLEIKTIAGYAAKQWETGIPPSYLIQLQVYLLITGLKRGEIAILKDGRYLEVIPFEENTSIQESIKRLCGDFWKRVTSARYALKQKFDLDYLPDQPTPEMIQAISAFEPPPDNSEAYRDFLQTRYQVVPIARPGRSEHYRKALEIQDHQETIKKIDQEVTLLSNQLKHYMGEAEELDFGAGGKVTWRPNKKGVRSFLIGGVKPMASEVQTENFKVADKIPVDPEFENGPTGN